MTPTIADREDVADLPPSTKFVLWILEDADRPLRKTEIEQRGFDLPERTVERSLSQLRERDLVERRPIGGGTYAYTTA